MTYPPSFQHWIALLVICTCYFLSFIIFGNHLRSGVRWTIKVGGMSKEKWDASPFSCSKSIPLTSSNQQWMLSYWFHTHSYRLVIQGMLYTQIRWIYKSRHNPTLSLKLYPCFIKQYSIYLMEVITQPSFDGLVQDLCV